MKCKLSQVNENEASLLSHCCPNDRNVSSFQAVTDQRCGRRPDLWQPRALAVFTIDDYKLTPPA